MIYRILQASCFCHAYIRHSRCKKKKKVLLLNQTFTPEVRGVQLLDVPGSLCGNSHSLLVMSSSSSSVWLKEFKESDLDLWGDSFPTSVGCRKTVWTSWMWALSSSQDSARKSQPSHCSTSITEHSLENQGNLQRREKKERNENKQRTLVMRRAVSHPAGTSLITSARGYSNTATLNPQCILISTSSWSIWTTLMETAPKAPLTLDESYILTQKTACFQEHLLRRDYGWIHSLSSWPWDKARAGEHRRVSVFTSHVFVTLHQVLLEQWGPHRVPEVAMQTQSIVGNKSTRGGIIIPDPRNNQ